MNREIFFYYVARFRPGYPVGWYIAEHDLPKAGPFNTYAECRDFFLGRA